MCLRMIYWLVIDDLKLIRDIIEIILSGVCNDGNVINKEMCDVLYG